MKLSVEPSYRVYDVEDGYYYEVRLDRDALGCIEVVYNEGRDGDKNQPAGAMSPEMALKVAECMIQLSKFRLENPL